MIYQHPPRSPSLQEGIITNITTVNELFHNDTKQWNQDLLTRLMQPEDAAEVLKIKVSPTQPYDLLGWNYTKDGIYTVKSGYWLSTHLPDREDIDPPRGDPQTKEKVWKLYTAPKIKHFLWRMLSQAMAIGTILKWRGIIQDAQCRRCCSDEESLDHLFFRCNHSQAIWRSSHITNPILLDFHLSFEVKFHAILDTNKNHHLSDFHRQLPLWILWRIWKSRNALVYQQQQSTWRKDIDHAKRETREWIATAPLFPTHHRNRARRETEWKRPPLGFVKCNYDCVFKEDGRLIGMAWILRDSQGFYLESGYTRGRVCESALEAELQALLMASQCVWSKEYQRIIFEGDNLMVSRLVNQLEQNFKLYNWVQDILNWQQKILEARVTWVPRHNNQEVDRITKEMDQNSSYFVYSYMPRFIVNFLHSDFLSSS